MGVGDGNLQEVIESDVEAMTMENCPILFLYGTYLQPVAIIMYYGVCDSNYYYRYILPGTLAQNEGKDFISLGCGVCCVFSSHPLWTSSSLDVPAGVTQEEGHTGFLIHLPSAVHALIFVARRIQPFLSLVDREVEFCVLTN